MVDLPEVAEPAPAPAADDGSSTSHSTNVTPIHDPSWTAFGLGPAEVAGAYLLPVDAVAFEASDTERQAALNGFLQAMELPPALSIKHNGRLQVLFRIDDPAHVPVLARSVADGVRVLAPGDAVVLPGRDAWQPTARHVTDVAGLSMLTAVEVSRVARPLAISAAATTVTNPLASYSLRGQSAAFREKAVEARPLLGGLCLSGQVTVWYAAPNTGKTLLALNLLIDAVRDRRIQGGNVFYINADDGSEGMATKMELLDDLGVHTLTPGFRNFSPKDLAPKLHEMAERDSAADVLVVVDTTKKFVKLMDKADSTAFGTACRRVAMGGGAVLNLAHTTKSPNADGTPRYTGTTDIVEDADAAYTIQLVGDDAGTGERIVQFHCFKRRGDNVMSAAYAYAGEDRVSYTERLASVREVDLDAVDQFKRVEAEQADAEILQAIATCVAEGINTKMVLGKEAASRAGVPVRRAYRLIEQYTGDDPEQHRWKFVVRERGAKTFELLPPPA